MTRLYPFLAFCALQKKVGMLRPGGEHFTLNVNNIVLQVESEA